MLDHICFTSCNKFFDMYFWLLSDTSCTRWLQVSPRLYGHWTRKPTGAETLDKQSTWKTLVRMSKQVNIALCVSASQQNALLLLYIQDMNFRGCLLLNRYTLSKNTWNPNPNIDLEHDNIVVHDLSHALIPTFSMEIYTFTQIHFRLPSVHP